MRRGEKFVFLLEPVCVTTSGVQDIKKKSEDLIHVRELYSTLRPLSNSRLQDEDPVSRFPRGRRPIVHPPFLRRDQGAGVQQCHRNVRGGLLYLRPSQDPEA